jgi:internalin A
MKFFLAFFLTFFIAISSVDAQRNKGLADKTPAEIQAEKYQDSMSKITQEAIKNFSIDDYFQQLKTLQRKQDSAQLNATYEFLKENESKADTMRHLYIQASTLSVFPESIKKYKNLEKLTLRRCRAVQLQDLFEKIKDLPNLTEISLEHSDKARLPENIYKLKSLKKLNLEGNKLNALPDSMAFCPQLEEINLRNNIYLDENAAFSVLSKIKTLKILNFSGSRLQSIPSTIGSMKTLESLNLSHNLITEIPEDVEKLKALKTLDLSSNKSLNATTSLVQISKISNLEKLFLNNSGISEIPSTIGALTQIKVLDLFNNPIKKIHSSIGDCSNLEEIYLGSDFFNKERMELQTIPASIGNCKKMKRMQMSLCSLSELPSSFENLQKLEFLDLSWNKFSQFPIVLTKLEGLKHLDLSINTISSLPDNFGKLSQNLETFLMAANFNTQVKNKITVLPSSIATLTKLKTLSLRDQVFETMPASFWTGLTQLEDLNLMGGLLQEIPIEIEHLTQLKKLNVKANEIKSISAGLGKCAQLEELNIAYNPDLDIDRTFQLLREMKQLKFLDISYNEFSLEKSKELQTILKNTKIAKDEIKESKEREPKKR